MESLYQWVETFVKEYGYISLFFISFSESIIQPIPPDPFIAGATAFGLNPLICAFVSTLGSVLGGLTAHFLGSLFGERFAIKILGSKTFLKGEVFFKKYGIWALIIGGLTPIPFKAVCWLAGIFSMHRLYFLVGSFVGRFPRFIFVAMGTEGLKSLMG